MVFSRFFQFLVKKPGFLVFSEKTEKTTNPGVYCERDPLRNIPWLRNYCDKIHRNLCILKIHPFKIRLH